jgi:colanic acid/amylovoran biosynthesis glycosyltransferase
MTAVAHFRTPFLSATETFIYQYLSRLGGEARPVVFTQKRENAESFPWDDVVDYSAPRGSWNWAKDNLWKRLAGRRNKPLLDMLRRRGVRVMHAHFGPEGWELLDVRRDAGLPMVTTFYGFDISKLPRVEGWKERFARLFSEGDLFLVEGPHMKKCLAALGCPEDKIRIQRIALDLSRIPFRVRPARAQGPARFLFCGRFTEKKGLLESIKAFGLLAEEGRVDFEYRLIGDGPQKAEAEALAAAPGLAGRVVFLGRKTHAEFYEELAKADVFVSPSVTASDGDTEGGAPTTILEAQAAGLPVAASRHADIPAVVVDGKSALLSEERDVPGLARNLGRLMDERNLWEPFGRAGRAHVENFHDIVKEASRLETVYGALMAGRRP